MVMKSYKSAVIHWLYVHILKPVFFLLDPEFTHDLMTRVGEMLGSNLVTRKIDGFVFNYADPMLEQTIFGINFKNPVGLAAGFDKDARLTKILPSVGFGFEEIGSVTGEPCEGNPRPRLWRLPKSRSLIVYYGLKNDGAEKISKRLFQTKFDFPVGISIAKTNSEHTVETEAGVADYLKAYKAFQDIGDYYTINISCPNAFGGQPFSDPSRLEVLLKAIYALPKTKPVFIKMPPDISHEQIDRIIELSEKYDIDGFVCVNLTKDRDLLLIKEKILDELPTDKGGLSGKVVESFSDRMIEYVYKKAGKKFVIIGCGGIFSAEDAYGKICAGASMVQLITGMIYEGPQLIGDINRGLVELLKRDGFKNVGEAVGANNKQES
jgi:dihydroorotate dehydrogenase